MNPRTGVTVVIPVYNRVDLLRDCLESLRLQTYRPQRIVIVDDASQEDVAACVKQMLLGADVVRRDTNGGFARAVNDGLRRVETPLVLLLNSDMTLEPDCLMRLVSGMPESGAAMVCPLVLFRDDPDTIYSAGDTILRGGRPVSLGFRQPRAGFQFDRRPFAVSAGAALYTRELFDVVGLFDEQFVAYFEDADLSMRARAAGFDAACVPEAVAYHVGSASIAGNTLWRTRQCHRNHALLVLKNYPLRRLLLDAPWIVAERLHQSHRLFSACRAERGMMYAAREWAAGTAEIARVFVDTALQARRKANRRACHPSLDACAPSMSSPHAPVSSPHQPCHPREGGDLFNR
jgi:GT2 family glycosyltransferase